MIHKPEKIELLLHCIDNFSPLKKVAVKRLIDLLVVNKPVVILRNDELKRELEGINYEFIRLGLASLAEKGLLEKHGWSTYVVKNEIFSAFLKANSIKIEARDGAYFFGGGNFIFQKGNSIAFSVTYERFNQIVAYLYSSEQNNRYVALYANIMEIFLKGNNFPVTQSALHRKHHIHIIGAKNFCESELFDSELNVLRKDVFDILKKGYIELNYGAA